MLDDPNAEFWCDNMTIFSILLCVTLYVSIKFQLTKVLNGSNANECWLSRYRPETYWPLSYELRIIIDQKHKKLEKVGER